MSSRTSCTPHSSSAQGRRNLPKKEEKKEEIEKNRQTTANGGGESAPPPNASADLSIAGLSRTNAGSKRADKGLSHDPVTSRKALADLEKVASQLQTLQCTATEMKLAGFGRPSCAGRQVAGEQKARAELAKLRNVLNGIEASLGIGITSKGNGKKKKTPKLAKKGEKKAPSHATVGSPNRQELTCWACGLSGHQRNSCPVKRSLHCNHCQRSGHCDATCRMKSASSGRKTRKALKQQANAVGKAGTANNVGVVSAPSQKVSSLAWGPASMKLASREELSGPELSSYVAARQWVEGRVKTDSLLNYCKRHQIFNRTFLRVQMELQHEWNAYLVEHKKFPESYAPTLRNLHKLQLMASQV